MSRYDYDDDDHFDNELVFEDNNNNAIFSDKDDLCFDETEMVELCMTSYIYDRKSKGFIPYYSEFCIEYGYFNNEDDLQRFSSLAIGYLINA